MAPKIEDDASLPSHAAATTASSQSVDIPASPFAYRDFRILWGGAFLSFIGSWVQNVAQAVVVYDLTRNKAMLGLVSFLGMLPISIIGPFAGTFADMFNKKRLLIVTQSIFAAGALFLAAALQYRFIQFWHIIVVALVVGTTGAIEMPTRQSVVSKVVPVELLPKAIPLNAMTFNLARLIGPGLGGFLLNVFGAQMCYSINGISYLALIVAALWIQTDLSPVRNPQPIKDLLFEGMLYTWRDKRLRTLFIMESIVATFGLIYLPMMVAIVAEIWHLNPDQYLGIGMMAVAVGAISGLVLMTRMSHKPWRAVIVRLAMVGFGIALVALSFVKTLVVALPMLIILGMAAMLQFNTTNMLFQTLSPEHLRGRVLAMHVWALAGAAPFGVLGAGWLAEKTSLSLTLLVGGLCVLAGGVWGWLYRKGLAGVE
jgi:MFS family permease